MPKSKRDTSGDRSEKDASSTTVRKKCGPGQPDQCPAGPRRPSSTKQIASNSSYNESTMSKMGNNSRKGSKKDINQSESVVFIDVDDSKKPKRYVPKPYTFRVPLAKHDHQEVHAVKSPPYVYQLDHTLSVVWMLFCKDEVEKPLGIVQLQWALTFLQGIFNEKGEHPKDIGLCIEAIQDQLIEQYAGMVEAYPPKKSKSKSKGCCGAMNCKGGGSQNKSGSKSKNSSKTSVASDKTSKSSINETTPPTYSQPTVSRNVPFSVNYAEMMRHSPSYTASNESVPNVEQIYIRSKASSVLEDSKLNRIPSDALSPTKSKEFLQTIRREQIDKIQAELKTLHLIEDFIAHTDKNPEDEFMDMPVMQSSPDKSSKKSKIPKKHK